MTRRAIHLELPHRFDRRGPRLTTPVLLAILALAGWWAELNVAAQDTALKREEVVAGRVIGKPAITEHRSEIPVAATPYLPYFDMECDFIEGESWLIHCARSERY